MEQPLVLATTLPAEPAGPWEKACLEALARLAREEGPLVLLNLHAPGAARRLPGWVEAPWTRSAAELPYWTGPARPMLRDILSQAAGLARNAGAQVFGFFYPDVMVRAECLCALRRMATGGLDTLAVSRTLIAAPDRTGPEGWVRMKLRGSGLLALRTAWWETGQGQVLDYVLGGTWWQQGVLGACLLNSRFHCGTWMRGAILAPSAGTGDPADAVNLGLVWGRDQVPSSLLGRYYDRLDAFISAHGCLPSARQNLELQEDPVLRAFRGGSGTSRGSS
jgi:hypothetical protein